MTLWIKIGDWIYEKLQVKFKFTVCEVIFGLPLTEDPLFDVLNCIIMYVKYYINGKRNKNKSLLFVELLGLIKEKVKILVQIEEDGCPVITDRGKIKVAFYKLLLV